ncbi:MAG: hypothetical protein SCM96_11065 [Acidobacteriota bacterium]|nr:hypothetical protein [Acidobacteriota bacterium]
MKIVPAVILGLALIASGLFPQDLPADVRERALKVIRLLESIDGAGKKAGSRARTAVVDEPCVNAFIAYQLAAGDDPLQELVLKLRPGDKVEGKAVLLLKGKHVPAFLQAPLPFVFEGRLESSEGRARFHIDRLFLNGQPIQPALLDMISALAQGVSGDRGSAGGLNDWYGIPYGIKRITIGKGALTLHY